MKITFDTGNIGKKEVKKLLVNTLLFVVIVVETLFILGNLIGTYTADFLSIVGKTTFTAVMIAYLYKLYRFIKKDNDRGGILKDIALYGLITAVLVFISSFLSGFVDGIILSAIEGIGVTTTIGKVVVTLLILLLLGVGFISGFRDNNNNTSNEVLEDQNNEVDDTK